ncbi:hypothetical protein JCM14720_23390 [Calditerricola yamamurae]
MRERWRVGTLSLGLSFVAVGILILFAQVAEKDIVRVFQLWWPLIFVLLGLEILGYLFLSKHGQPVIRYDLFSLFLVGIIGFAGTLLLLFASTGLLEEIRQAVTLVEVSRDVTPLQKDIPARVSRIVLLNPEHNAIRLEKGKTNELHLFGTCTTQTLPEEATAPVRAEEIVSVRTVGDTMYVTIRRPPEKQGIVHRASFLRMTVVVPQQVNVEVDPPLGT